MKKNKRSTTPEQTAYVTFADKMRQGKIEATQANVIECNRLEDIYLASVPKQVHPTALYNLPIYKRMWKADYAG